MRYEPIDPSVVQEVIDGIHPSKDVDAITGDLMEWSGFLQEIIKYIKALVDALKDFMNGD